MTKAKTSIPVELGLFVALWVACMCAMGFSTVKAAQEHQRVHAHHPLVCRGEGSWVNCEREH